MSDTAKTDKSQLDKFKEAAHALECDDDEERFKKRLSTIVKPKEHSVNG